jgi:hypothetical protein
MLFLKVRNLGLKSRNLGGRPKIDRELRDLIQRMCKENPLWGAPRIHGELLKLGFNVAQSTVSKYMLKHPGLPRQSWKTFLRNHANGIALRPDDRDGTADIREKTIERDQDRTIQSIGPAPL